MKNQGFFTRRICACGPNIAGYGKGRVIDMELHVGDRIKMKKQHPCGTNCWQLLRVGMDIRMECTGCGHQVMLPRKQVEKGFRGFLNETS